MPEHTKELRNSKPNSTGTHVEVREESGIEGRQEPDMSIRDNSSPSAIRDSNQAASRKTKSGLYETPKEKGPHMVEGAKE